MRKSLRVSHIQLGNVSLVTGNLTSDSEPLISSGTRSENGPAFSRSCPVLPSLGILVLTTSRKVVLGAAPHAGSLAANAVVSLPMMPFVVRILGDRRYDIWIRENLRDHYRGAYNPVTLGDEAGGSELQNSGRAEAGLGAFLRADTLVSRVHAR